MREIKSTNDNSRIKKHGAVSEKGRISCLSSWAMMNNVALVAYYSFFHFTSRTRGFILGPNHNQQSFPVSCFYAAKIVWFGWMLFLLWIFSWHGSRQTYHPPCFVYHTDRIFRLPFVPSWCSFALFWRVIKQSLISEHTNNLVNN